MAIRHTFTAQKGIASNSGADRIRPVGAPAGVYSFPPLTHKRKTAP